MQSELKLVLKKIEELRKELEDILSVKEMTEPDVVSASQLVDAMLNEYHKLLKKKMDKS